MMKEQGKVSLQKGDLVECGKDGCGSRQDFYFNFELDRFSSPHSSVELSPTFCPETDLILLGF